MPISFFSEEIDFELPEEQKIADWIASTIFAHHFQLEELSYIFCSDDYLLGVNQRYLDHDYYTDIITFDNSEEQNKLSGDLFISIDRIHDNAQQNGQTFETELHRVMIHGVLHLLGFNDKTDDEKSEMRRKEDACLSLLQ